MQNEPENSLIKLEKEILNGRISSLNLLRRLRKSYRLQASSYKKRKLSFSPPPHGMRELSVLLPRSS